MATKQSNRSGRTAPNGSPAATGSEDSVSFPVGFVEDICRAASTDDLFNTVAGWLPRIIDCARASLALKLDRENLRIVAFEGDDVIPMEMPIPIHATMTGASYGDKEVKITHDIGGQDLEMIDLKMLKSIGISSVANVPLLMNDECFGTLNLGHPEPHFFNLENLGRIRTLAFWIASQLSHHQKLEELKLGRQREEEQIIAREAAERASSVKSQFLANMSHELRTPMNGVIGMAELMLRTDMAGKQRHYCQRILQSGEDILRLVDDILDLSKIEAGRLELDKSDYDLSNLLDAVAAVLDSRAQQKGLAVDFIVADDTPRHLVGDMGRVQQVLLNLIGNAIKFTDKGAVSVYVACSQTDGETAELRFEVSDTGVGISAEALDRIFDTFTQADSSTTRDYGGTGLGLSICRQLVQSMGGDIGVDSVVGAGSTFWFTLVCDVGAGDGTVTPDVSKPDPNPAVGRAFRILVAEDNAVNQEVILEILNQDGHSVRCVENGEEVLAVLGQERFDLVLMDIHMPTLDGVETTKRIRALPGDVADIPIVALTANAMVGDDEKYIAAGMNDYASKPIDPDQLYAAMLRVVGSA